LRYLPAYRLIVCKDHGAVLNWRTHLSESHKISKKIQTELDAQYQIQTLQLLSFKDHPLPLPNQPPIPILGDSISAYACSNKSCTFITASCNSIHKHYNKEHNWISSPQDRKPWACIQAQTFFRSGGRQRYFQVQPLPLETSSLSASTTTDAVSHIVQQIQSSQAKHAESLAIADATIAKTDHTGWFNRNRWPIHLASCNLIHLNQASRMPDKNDNLLGQAVEVVEQVVEQAVSGLSTLALETRRWLKSPNPEQIDSRPMARLQNPDSQKRYTGYMSALSATYYVYSLPSN
jgi:hypothetical protein